MTVRGLPGLPGKTAMIEAIDDFTQDCLSTARLGVRRELCGVFWFDAMELRVEKDSGDAEWSGVIRWRQLANKAGMQGDVQFTIDSGELQQFLLEKAAEHRDMALKVAQVAGKPVAGILAQGFSPLVGLGHSHPGGTDEPSHADHRTGEATSQWRRAYSPQALWLGQPDDAQFYEVDMLLAIHDAPSGESTLVHYKRGRTEGKWKGNF